MVQNKWLVLSNTTLGQMMAVLDGNIVIIALPVIGRELPGASALDLVWIVIGYQLVLSSVMVNFGRMGDIFGRALSYKTGFAVFTAGSALCSLSQNGPELVGFRLIQGVGAALLMANSTALVTDAFPVAERGKAMGLNGIAVSTGSVIGLALGGFITGTLGWRAIFWVNIPIGIFAIVWSHYRLRVPATVSRGEKIDVTGNVTFFAALTLFLSSITLYAISLLTGLEFIFALGGSIAAFAAFLRIESRARYPMMKLSLFRVKAFGVSNLIAIINSLASGAVLLVLTFYLQGSTMNLTPFYAGVFLLPNAVSTIIFAPVSGTLSDRFGTNIFTTVGPICAMIGCLMLAQLGPTVSFVQLALPLLLIGSGMSTFIPPNRTEVMSSVGPEQRGIASGIYNTSLNVGNTLSRGFAFLIMGLTLTTAEVQSVFGASGTAATSIASTQFIVSLDLVFYASTAVFGLGVALSLLKFAGLIGARAKAPTPA